MTTHNPLPAYCVIILALAGAGLLPASAETAQTCRALACAMRESSTAITDYDVSGTVVAKASLRFGYFRVFLEDESGPVAIGSDKLKMPPELEAGDIIRSTGIIQHHLRGKTGCEIRTIERIGTGKPPVPVEVPLAEVVAGKHDYRRVITHGTIRDAFVDDIDPRFAYLVVCKNDDMLFVAFPAANHPDLHYSELFGSEVTLNGFADPELLDNRPRIIRMFSPYGDDGILIKKSTNSASSPTIDFKTAAHLPPKQLAKVGPVRIRGKVIAAWGGRNFILKTDEAEFSRIETEEADLPPVGDFVEAIGRPTTDLNYINLFRARWTKIDPLPISENPVKALAVADLIGTTSGIQIFHPAYSCEPVRLEGELVEYNRTEQTIMLSTGGEIIPVHCPFACEAATGSRIAVTGICLLDSERWSPDAPFPRIRGIRLVARTPDDIVVLRSPPWWTPARVLTLVLTLVGLLVAVLLWNFLLKRLARRLAKDLAHSEIEQVTSEFKVAERTRMAVELHDAVSQNLTAVGLEIDAARGFFKKDPDQTLHHLDVAGATLKSCRNELKNCLWDLRNQTLELPDFTDAIRRTLAQHIGEAELQVRFTVPRQTFSDNTAHNLLRILRELASNAVRHGHAAKIRVAGAVENGNLLVSVSDNGCGFDIAEAPGIDQGHFGLEGIRERIETMGGTFTLASSPGHGCRAVIRMPVPKESEAR